MRLWPLGPMPRSDTPWVVGCAAMALVRRNRLKLGIWRRMSSAMTAGEALIVSLVTTLTLAGIVPRRRSVRVAVTTTDSSTEAGWRVTVASPAPSGCCATANPGARTMTVPDAGGLAMVKRPSPSVTVRCSPPDAVRTITVAPTMTSPLVSETTPVSGVTACARARRSASTMSNSVCEGPARGDSVARCGPLESIARRPRLGPRP